MINEFVYHTYCPKCGEVLTHYSIYHTQEGQRIYNLGNCVKCNVPVKLKMDHLIPKDKNKYKII